MTPEEKIEQAWEGHKERECGEHRTTGGRAWCFEDSEWCYERIPCRGCEMPLLKSRLKESEALIGQLQQVAKAARTLVELYSLESGAAYEWANLSIALAALAKREGKG